MTNSEIVMRLIGSVAPIGKTEVDNERFDNLKELCELTNILVTIIDEVAYDNKDRYEFSMKRAGEYASKFLTETLGIK